MAGIHFSPIPTADQTNWSGVGMNLVQMMQQGSNAYQQDQRRAADIQAGGLASQGNFQGAQNLMLSRGYAGSPYQTLYQEQRNQAEEAAKTGLTKQAGALVAAGDREGAARLLYGAGRFAEAQALEGQARNTEKETFARQASQAAGQGDFETAAEIAYQTGDHKLAEHYREQGQKAGVAKAQRELGMANALDAALEHVETPEEFQRTHSVLARSGYPPELLQKYSDPGRVADYRAELAQRRALLQAQVPVQEKGKVAAEKMPVGYREKHNPDGTPVVDASGRPQLEPIPGGPAEKEAAETAFKHGLVKKGLEILPRAFKHLVGTKTEPVSPSALSMSAYVGDTGHALRAVDTAIDAFLRGTTGAVISETERAEANTRFKPAYMDTPKTRRRKLTDLKEMLELQEAHLAAGRSPIASSPAAEIGKVTVDLGTKTAPPAAAPQRPPSVPNGAQYSPSRQQWRDSAGRLYDASGRAL